MTGDLHCCCGRRLSRQAAIATRAGVMCKRCADHLPPYLRRPPKPRPKAATT